MNPAISTPGHAFAPAFLPQQLGDPSFRADHGVQLALVISGAMGWPKQSDRCGFVYHVFNRSHSRGPLFLQTGYYEDFLRIMSHALKHLPGCRHILNARCRVSGILSSGRKRSRRLLGRPKKILFFTLSSQLTDGMIKLDPHFLH